MMHENFMHWHLCMFAVRCSYMKLYTMKPPSAVRT